jgi:hypothetical protein
MTSLQWFRILAPEFSALTDAQVNALIAAATVFVSTAGLNTDQANAALALYAAHLQWITVNHTGSGSNSGNVKSEREGDLSRTYGTMQGDDTWIGQSPYGMQFNDIMKAVTGSCLMTRYGLTIPQGVDVG